MPSMKEQHKKYHLKKTVVKVPPGWMYYAANPVWDSKKRRWKAVEVWVAKPKVKKKRV